MSLAIKQIVNSPVTSNCYIVSDKSGSEGCIIVDPGSEDILEYIDYMKQEGLTPSYIFLTHEHFDHCWGVNELRDTFPMVKLVCSKICSDAIQSGKKNYSVFYQQPGFEINPANIILDDVGWQLDWNGEVIKLYSSQGHSAAGIIFFIDKYVFTGDTLIKGIKTVTKLKTASKEKLKETMALLEAEKGRGLVVCPGHGEIFDLDNYALEKAF